MVTSTFWSHLSKENSYIKYRKTLILSVLGPLSFTSVSFILTNYIISLSGKEKKYHQGSS